MKRGTADFRAHCAMASRGAYPQVGDGLGVEARYGEGWLLSFAFGVWGGQL